MLVLALLPTWAVLAGAGWLWTERSEEIAQFEDALVPVDITHELFLVSSRMLRAEASLQLAALPGASDDILERSRRDHGAALDSIRAAEQSLTPLVEQLDPQRDGGSDQQILLMMSGTMTLAIELLDAQIPGEPVDPRLTAVVSLARQSASGLVLPFVNSSSTGAHYLYAAMAATIEYQDQFDRDRAEIVICLLDGELIGDHLVSSTLRDAEWKDVTDSRSFAPIVGQIGWFGTSANPDAPLLLDTTEPLGNVLVAAGSAPTQIELDRAFLQIQHIDDALEADVGLAHRELRREAHADLAVLRRERLLTGLTSCLMAFLGVALATLTFSEVRRRRNVEAAHSEALTLLGEKADRDPTTGVWNRRRLESSMEAMIVEAPTVDEIVVVAYLDLDHFKAINDVWGHSTGDFVLRTVTERLHDFSYDDVAFELCRFGGDEFVLFTQMPHRSIEWFEGLGTAILNAVDSEMEVNGRRHEVGASVGIATSAEDSTLDSLLLEADSSMLLAKRDRGVAVVYDRNISRTGELVHALPAALSTGEICAHIQPVIDVTTGQVVHVEALARWNRTNGETVSPSVFIPLVESYGLAEKLTTTVLECVQHLIKHPSTPSKVRVWVNVSPRELDVANFAERFVAMLRNIEVPPTRIGLEITETAAVRDPERLAIELRRLRDVGIAVAIDDFGNGYSPLGYLRLLPVDVVKLDRSLISNIDQDVANQHLVIGIVGLVHQLGMSIVAEGVERVEEQEWLADQGVTRVQGFLFGRPTSPTGFDWTNRRVPTRAAATIR